MQKPMVAFEGHLSYDFKKRGLWASLDGNYWAGGETNAGGVENSNAEQRNSRLGALPRFRSQSINH
ncbi:MAG: transporter, partial [Terracidiphilus sp.]